MPFVDKVGYQEDLKMITCPFGQESFVTSLLLHYISTDEVIHVKIKY